MAPVDVVHKEEQYESRLNPTTFSQQARLCVGSNELDEVGCGRDQINGERLYNAHAGTKCNVRVARRPTREHKKRKQQRVPWHVRRACVWDVLLGRPRVQPSKVVEVKHWTRMTDTIRPAFARTILVHAVLRGDRLRRHVQTEPSFPFFPATRDPLPRPEYKRPCCNVAQFHTTRCLRPDIRGSHASKPPPYGAFNRPKHIQAP